MSGHSKWATIKRKKGANDAKRSKVFTKIIKEITVATRLGVADPDSNPRLRFALQNAKGANMPKDTIERAIKKGSGKDGTNYSEVTYEAYAPNGIALFIECTTDSINRTVANIRAILNRYGGSLTTNGALDFIFSRKGVFTIPKGNLEEESFTFEMIDAGAEDVESDEGYISITCSINDFGKVHKKLEEMKIEAETAELERVPTMRRSLDIDTSKKVLKLVEMIEDEDDVQKVFHNLEMDEKLMESIGE